MTPHVSGDSQRCGEAVGCSRDGLSGLHLQVGLLQDGDSSGESKAARSQDHRVFELRVDWDAFSPRTYEDQMRSRMNHGAQPGEDEDRCCRSTM